MVFGNQKCSNHPHKRALSFCKACNEFFCENCLTEAAGYYFCQKPTCVASGNFATKQIAHQKRESFKRYFCERCLDETENESSDSISSLNGIGLRFISSSKPCSDCGSVKASVWFCILFIPLIRIERYRVVFGSGSSFFLGQKFVSRKLKKGA